MERKLASIQEVSAVAPHSNADSLDIARVLGWNVCVKRGEFKVGDKCVYCEVDSVLPEKPEFEFLRTKSFRIKTIRLRGQISQGIVFPLSILPSGEYEVGQDVTQVIGVVKYDPPLPANIGGDIKGHFPSFLRKTDEIRIQAVPQLLERYRGSRFYVTEKLDGCSTTYFFRDGEFGVCSRNYELKETDTNTLWRVAKASNLPEKFKTLGRNIAIQGELIGEGIQGNKYKIKGQQFRPFNAFDIDAQKRIDAIELFNLCDTFGLNPVPLIDFNFVLNHSVDELVASAIGKSRLNEAADREGWVIRYIVEKFDEDVGDLSFKVINPEFLLKHGE